MKTNSQLRRQARFGLEGNWGMMALCYLLIILMSYILMLPIEAGAAISAIKGGSMAGMNSVFASVWQVLVSIALLPASWMITIMCLRLVRGECKYIKPTVRDMFEGYRHTNKVVLTYLLLYLFIIAVIAIPVFFIYDLANGNVVSRDSANIISGAFALVAIILLLTVLLRFAMYPYLIWDTKLNAWDILKKSNNMMKGRCFKLFLLYCSCFINWFVLAGLTGLMISYFWVRNLFENPAITLLSIFGVTTVIIVLLWVMPYLSASVAAFYEDLKTEEEVVVEENPSTEVKNTIEENFKPEAPAALDVEPKDEYKEL